MLTTLTAIVTTTHRALQGIIASTTLEILSAGHVLYNRGNMNDKSMPVQVGRYMAALSARPKHRDATLLPAHVELSRHLRATGAPVEMLTHMPSFLWTQERSKKARDFCMCCYSHSMLPHVIASITLLLLLVADCAKTSPSPSNVPCCAAG